jgi:hypothetical protein
MNHVYVLDFNDRIKIGRTADVPRRIHEIENASGQKLTRLFSIEADPLYETALHDRLSEHRGVGEYFTYPYEEAVALLQSLIAENLAEKARLEREKEQQEAERGRLERECQRLEREKERQEVAQAKKQERQAQKIAIKAAEIGDTPKSDTDESAKFINIRFKETDYMRLKKLFGGHGVNITDACRKSVFHLADLLEVGAYDLNQGGFFDKRR